MSDWHCDVLGLRQQRALREMGPVLCGQGAYPAGDTVLASHLVSRTRSSSATSINWAKVPWAFACERYPFPLGQLKKFCPQIMSPPSAASKSPAISPIICRGTSTLQPARQIAWQGRFIGCRDRRLPHPPLLSLLSPPQRISTWRCALCAA